MDERDPRWHKLDCVLYTSNTRVTGRMETAHGRVSDALNLPDTQFATVQDVDVRSLFQDDVEQTTAASVMIRRADAILVSLAPETTDGPRPVIAATQADRAATRLVLEVGPFTVSGTAHVPAGDELLHYVTETPLPFLAMTVARVIFRPDPTTTVSLPFVMVNRQWVRAITIGAHDVTPEWRTARERWNDATTAEERDTARSLDAADGLVQVLLETALFGGGDSETMTKVVRELGVLGGISRRGFASGSEIFREGDFGDSLYVVADGALEVLTLDKAQGGIKRAGTLSQGDVFGEAALLGERRRTASVVGTSSGTLYEIKEDALKQLLVNVPTSANALLRIMVQRRGPVTTPLRHLA